MKTIDQVYKTLIGCTSPLREYGQSNGQSAIFNNTELPLLFKTNHNCWLNEAISKYTIYKHQVYICIGTFSRLWESRG